MNPVLVVGAGPAGLALALALARHSVPSVVLEAREEQPEQRAARTCLLHPDTAAQLPPLPGLSLPGLQVWRRHHLIRHDHLRPAGSPTASRRPAAIGRRPELEAAPDHEGGNALDGFARSDSSDGTADRAVPAGDPHRTRLDDDTAAPLHLPQHLLHQALYAALAEEELVRLVPGSRLESLEQDEDGVTAHTMGANGTSWRGSYLVGCDGARSTVRKLLQIRFPGRTSVERHAVATIRAQLPWGDDALLHRDPGGGVPEILARPLPDGLWRLDWLLPPRGELVTPDQVLDRTQETLDRWQRLHDDAQRGEHGGGRRRQGGTSTQTGPYELVDTGVHTVHQRLARRWRTRRAFLAGDAAHQSGALGVQQVDEGLRDVANLAWKLALAWRRGDAATEDEGCQRLLDSYEFERRGAVGARLRAVDQLLPLVRRGGGLRTLLGTGVRSHLDLLADAELGRGPLGAPATVRDSPLMPERGAVAGATCATPVGALVEDVPVTALDGHAGRLHERLWGAGGDLLVVLVAPGTRVWESRHWLSAGMMPQLAATVEELPLRAQLLVTEEYPGAAAHTMLVVRPDGHLVAALPSGRTGQLRACADAARGVTAAHRALEGRKPAGRRG